MRTDECRCGPCRRFARRLRSIWRRPSSLISDRELARLVANDARCDAGPPRR